MHLRPLQRAKNIFSSTPRRPCRPGDGIEGKINFNTLDANPIPHARDE